MLARAATTPPQQPAAAAPPRPRFALPPRPPKEPVAARLLSAFLGTSTVPYR